MKPQPDTGLCCLPPAVTEPRATGYRVGAAAGRYAGGVREGHTVNSGVDDPPGAGQRSATVDPLGPRVRSR
ncbi:hypothetical protein [Nocardia sp. CS682]|uniref:hypothetical protein n=1 Tax=Nocardia sp. CS682 TaxID=1047172 RepID=UPI0010750CE5|nr:hypothetical protein [Nocardia sp. CS682]QBS40157.1 hypothetical protein DMB37_08510 [Nocardia sp. CS682]